MLAERLDLGAASLGILMTANGGGMLMGGFLSGWASRLARGRLGLTVLGIDSLAGLALAALAYDHSTAVGAVLLTTTGVLMFTFLGLGPLSAAVAGSLLTLISLPVPVRGRRAGADGDRVGLHVQPGAAQHRYAAPRAEGRRARRHLDR